MSSRHFIMIAFAKHSPLTWVTWVAFHQARGKGIASLLNRHEPSTALAFSNQPERGGPFDLVNTEPTKSASARIPPMPKLSAHARARKIKLLLFDVDGVLTDGKLFIFPAPAGAQQTVLQQSVKHGGQGGFGAQPNSHRGQGLSRP